jgi:hypothetical protein
VHVQAFAFQENGNQAGFVKLIKRRKGLTLPVSWSAMLRKSAEIALAQTNVNQAKKETEGKSVRMQPGDSSGKKEFFISRCAHCTDIIQLHKSTSRQVDKSTTCVTVLSRQRK